MKNFIEKYGPWALVTGGSSGIGAELARQLAGKGVNLILVARRKERMEQLAKQLHDLYGTESRVIEMDLTTAGAVADLHEQVRGLDIGLVVANAGMETDGGFLRTGLKAQEQLIQLNCMVPMQMAHRFGNDMAARGRGGLMLVSSSFGYQAVPYFANYAASKAYVLMLGEALHQEFKDKNIDVTVLSPGLTATEMPGNINIDFSKLPMKAMQVSEVADTALRSLQRRQASVIPGMANRFMAFMAQRLMSRRGVAAMFAGMNRKAMPTEHL